MMKCLTGGVQHVLLVSLICINTSHTAYMPHDLYDTKKLLKLLVLWTQFPEKASTNKYRLIYVNNVSDFGLNKSAKCSSAIIKAY